MKRFISVTLSLLLALGLLSGCGKSDSNLQAGNINTSDGNMQTGNSSTSDGNLQNGNIVAGDGKETGVSDSENSVNAAGLTEEYFFRSDADMFTDRDSSVDYDEENSIRIQLNGTSAVASSDSVRISGSTITITENVTHIISGTLDDGMIVVDAEDTAKLQLVLDGVNINSETSAPLYILEADKVFVTLADNTDNTLSNGGTFTAIDQNNIDSVIFSKQDITLNGSGALNVNSPAGHGIVSKDDLVITGGTYYVSCASNGLEANDSVRITGNTALAVNAGKDGIHAENDEETSLGFVYISNGSIEIEAEGDGISAGAYLQMEGGVVDILAGGGSENGTRESSDSWGRFGGGRMDRIPSSAASNESGSAIETDDGSSSMKGLKAEEGILISDGTIKVDSADDAIHSNSSITINGGDFEIASGDDGVHADESLTITAGNINITESYEGLEALSITIMGGDINLTATDDGINAAGGTDSSGTTGGRDGMYGGKGGMSSSNGKLSISGGNLYIRMGGDGLDSNGSLSISGGTVLVSGASSGDTSILDYDAEGIINGGTFIGTGASGMAQHFSASSTQGAILVSTGNQLAGTEIKLTDSNGNVLVSHTAERDFSCVIISHASIVNGGAYVLAVGSSDFDITMDSTVYGSGNSGGMGGNRHGNWDGGRDSNWDGGKGGNKGGNREGN